MAVPATSVLPLALTSSIDVPMAPSSHGLDVPASRTDSIQRPLPLADGFGELGERLQADGVIGASVTFSSCSSSCAGRWKLAA